MYQKILVPLDGSELAEKALRHAAALAKSLNAQIILLRVVVFPTRDFDIIPMEAAVSPAMFAEAKHYLEHAAGSLRRMGIAVTTATESGRVADKIIDYVTDHQIDLIVMSTHGRAGAARWLLGSVADRIVHAAPVPVFLVRPQD